MTRKIVKRSTFFAPDHLKVWPTVGPGSTGNLDWIMQICIIIESNEVFLDQNFCRVLSWNYDFKKTIIFNLWLLNHCPLWEPKFSDPDAKKQTFFFYFLFYFSVLLVPSLVNTPCCLAGKLIASAPSSVHWSTGTLGSCFMSNTDWPTSFPRDISLSSAWLCCMQLGLWMWSAAELTSLLLPMHVEAYALTG